MSSLAQDDALRQELAAVEARAAEIHKALDALRRAREGEGWLCWPCTEEARAAGCIRPGESIYHQRQPCKKTPNEADRGAD